MTIELATVYCTGRSELAARLLASASHPHLQEAVSRLLWSEAYTMPDGWPCGFLPDKPGKSRLEVVGFTSQPLAVEKIHDRFLRLAVNTNWYLDLTPYRQGTDFLKSLSKKTQKNLRWLRNVYERERFQFMPIRNHRDLEKFLQIYLHNWPDSVWGKRLREPWFAIYLELEKLGKNRSFLLQDQAGNCVGGALGYETAHAFNLHMLCRKEGLYDKYSPVFFTAFWLVEQMIAHSRLSAFFFGPGEFDYKKRLLGQCFPIYRYEKLSWKNMFGIIKLYYRYRKERRKRAQAEECDES